MATGYSTDGFGIPRGLQTQLALLALLATALFGILGYMTLEDMTPREAIYTTIMVFTTIGMKNASKPMSPTGEIFTAFLAVLGLVIVVYTVGFLVRDIIGGELQRALGRRIMKRHVSALKNHFILCGYGRIGRIIAAELRDSRQPMLVIEPNDDNYQQLSDDGLLGIHGDALDDETLEQAGLKQARALISTIDSDADNVFLILSARRLNPAIHLVVRGESESAIAKLRQVGASAVISPLTIGAESLAQAAIRPAVARFIKGARGEQGYRMEEAPVSDTSPLAGKSLREQDIAREHNVMVIGIHRRSEADAIFNPSASTVIHAGDVLIVLGEEASIERFRSRAQG